MKRIGVLGGMSPQATMDFEARVHRLCQTLVPQHWNAGYPPMLVWYHRGLPVRIDAGGRPILPMQVDPDLVEAAAWLGKGVDFLVIPCNAAHVGLAEIRSAAGCAVVSMVDATLDDVIRRGWRRVGVLGFRAAPSPPPARHHLRDDRRRIPGRARRGHPGGHGRPRRNGGGRRGTRTLD